MKSMTKRLLAALLAVAALFALVGCSKSDKANAARRSSTTPARTKTTNII